MLSYALKRLLGAVPTLFFIITAAFFLMRVAPGGPFDQERTLEPSVMANLNATFGLDRPLPAQYL
ncbi:MAG: ABC transporter, partial [Rhodobacteraceae bacterium]|nr:ABC transporter [Paracoccaceae bacterium]